MSICFIAAGPITWTSSRLRCYWPAQYLGAQVVPFADLARRPLPRADVYVWQKQVRLDLLPARRTAQHWWDVSEPAWWFEPEACRELVQHMSGFVASNENLALDFSRWSGRFCHVIPDRLQLSYFTRQRAHTPTSPVRLIWFGAAVNRVSLATIWSNLLRLAANGHAVELTIMDDRPGQELGFGDRLRVHHVRWAWQREVAILASHDVALLPPLPGPWGSVRSNYKQLTAWACGLPVTDGHDYDELVNLVSDHTIRAARGRAGRQQVEALWTVDRSAQAWRALLQPASSLTSA
ncbi:MAG: hypothetical protein KC425_05530 [Anaerolineales bacterium]|nr:hypothetical protein [Anaerolineales bacterium]